MFRSIGPFLRAHNISRILYHYYGKKELKPKIKMIILNYIVKNNIFVLKKKEKRSIMKESDMNQQIIRIKNAEYLFPSSLFVKIMSIHCRFFCSVSLSLATRIIFFIWWYTFLCRFSTTPFFLLLFLAFLRRQCS